MSRVWVVLLGVVLLAGGAQAQSAGADTSFVGSWGTVSDVADRTTGNPVTLHAMIEFKADSSYVAVLVSDDGSGEPGLMPPTRGYWATVATGWSVPMVCVRSGPGAEVHCQRYEFVQDSEGETVLIWGGVPFWRLDTSLETLLDDSICQDRCLDS